MKNHSFFHNRLTNEEAKKNWDEYGNPDGPGGKFYDFPPLQLWWMLTLYHIPACKKPKFKFKYTSFANIHYLIYVNLMTFLAIKEKIFWASKSQGL